LKHATDLERVCICAIQGRRNGEADVVVGLGKGWRRYCCRGRRHRRRPLWVFIKPLFPGGTQINGYGWE
jgi:hypothetical protein